MNDQITGNWLAGLLALKIKRKGRFIIVLVLLALLVWTLPDIWKQNIRNVFLSKYILASSAQEQTDLITDTKESSNRLQILANYKKGSRSEAIDQLMTLVNKNEDRLDQYLLGEMLYEEGDIANAILHWERAGYYRKAMAVSWDIGVSEWDKSPDQALHYFESVIHFASLVPNKYWEAEGHRMVCATYRKKKLWDRALQSCNEALVLMPDLHTALAEKGYVLVAGYQRNEEGKWLIQRALELSPGNRYYQNLPERLGIE